MNKLVSKNPILRFKEGRKIIFAKEGTYRGIRVLLVSTSGGKEMYGYDDPITGKRTLIYGNLLDTKIGKGNANGRVYKGSDGKWYQNGRRMQSDKLHSSNPEIKQKQTVRKPVSVTKPAVTKPAVVANRAAAGYILPDGVTDVAAILRLLKEGNYYNLDYVNSGKKIDDGIWGKETQAAWQAYNKNKLAANVGGTTGTTPNVTYTPTNTGTTVSGNGYNFTLPTNINTNTNANTNIYESYYPGTYNAPEFYNGRRIRREGKGNYANRSEYWDWLLNNRDSNLYKLWSNVFGNDGYLNEEIYNNMMSLYGINDEDFNSKKLATLLNDLNLIGVKGSDARKTFLTNFNRNLPSSEEINEYVRTNTSARPNLSTINWGLSPRTISNDNPFINIDKSKYPHLFAKNGGLISKNPIKRFKSNFR